MTEFEKIIKAIAPFGFPYAPDVYTGEAERYFVYNYADERGAIYGDDVPLETVASVQVHLYLPWKEDFISLKNKVRKSLLREGFTYPEVTNIKDEDKRHIIFECEIEEELEE